MEAFVKSCCPEFIRFASFQSGVVALSSSSLISKHPLHHSTGRIKFNPSFKVPKRCNFAILYRRILMKHIYQTAILLNETIIYARCI